MRALLQEERKPFTISYMYEFWRCILLSVDEAEKRAVEYLKNKFNASSIDVQEASPAQVGTLFIGRFVDKDETKNFEVTIGTAGKILGWKITPMIKPVARTIQ